VVDSSLTLLDPKGTVIESQQLLSLSNANLKNTVASEGFGASPIALDTELNRSLLPSRRYLPESRTK
jgi:hypothetical protein